MTVQQNVRVHDHVRPSTSKSLVSKSPKIYALAGRALDCAMLATIGINLKGAETEIATICRSSRSSS